MPEIKTHLKNLYRTKLNDKSRRGYLRLDMNECVPGLEEDLVKEIIAQVNADYLATYPEYQKLEEKIAAHNNLDPANICLANGSDAAIKYIFDAYVRPQDKVLLTDPTFAMYPVYCEMFNALPIKVEYKPDLSFPAEELLNQISSDLRLIVIVNPNNPTGSVTDIGDLKRIIEKAVNNDVLIIVDEAYFYFYPHTLIRQVKNTRNLIVLRTFSKLCGIASLRLGYAAAGREVIEDLRRVRPTYDINGISLLFAEKILESREVIPRLIKEINAGKQYLVQNLSAEGIEYKAGFANFVLIRCDERVDEIMRRLNQANILVSGGFRQGFLKDYIRVTAAKRAAMEEFWQSFIKIWKTKKSN